MTFEERCQTDPQGVIQDLVKQTTRQGLEIHGLNELITKLAENAEVKVLIEKIKSEPKEKKKKGKKKPSAAPVVFQEGVFSQEEDLKELEELRKEHGEDYGRAKTQGLFWKVKNEGKN